MLTRLGHFFRSFDFVGPEVKLRTYGITKFKTIFGGMISFIMSGLVIIIALYFSKIFLFRQFIWIVENETINRSPIVHHASEKFGIAVVDDNGHAYPHAEQMFHITAEQVNITARTKVPDYLTSIPLHLVQCTENPAMAEYEGKLDISFEINNFLCIEDGDVTIEGNPSINKTSSYIALHISKCNGNASCLSESAIDSALKKSFIVIKYIDSEVDNFNSSSACQTYVREEVIPLISFLPMEYIYLFRTVIYGTDYNWFIFEESEEHFFQVEQRFDRVQENLNEGNSYLAVIKFMASDKMTLYRRNYYKFQDALANIGGILESFLFFCHTIQHYLTKRINYISIANEVISFGDGKSAKKTENIRPSVKKTFYERQSVIRLNNFCFEQFPQPAKKEKKEKLPVVNFAAVREEPVDYDKGEYNRAGTVVPTLNINPADPGTKCSHYSDRGKHLIRLGGFSEIKKKDTYNSQMNGNRNSMNDESEVTKKLQNLDVKNISIGQISQIPLMAEPGSPRKRKQRIHSIVGWFHHEEKQTNLRFKISSENNYINLTLKDFFCDRVFHRRSQNIKLLEKAERYINEKISIEFILKKLNEVDKMKFVIFNHDQLNVLHSIPNPNFYEIFLEKGSQAGQLAEIDQLWSKYEFYQARRKEQNESYSRLKALKTIDPISEKLLSLVQGSPEK